MQYFVISKITLTEKCLFFVSKYSNFLKYKYSMPNKLSLEVSIIDLRKTFDLYFSIMVLHKSFPI